MALEVNAVARDVYPDTWIVYPENGNGQILVQADGLAGVVGEIKGGTIHDPQSAGLHDDRHHRPAGAGAAAERPDPGRVRRRVDDERADRPAW
jgi:hypothetical protein